MHLLDKNIPIAFMKDFEALYNAHYDEIFNYCFRRIGEFETARDVCSQVFLRVLGNHGRFRDRGIPKIHWIYRIATNEINGYFRSKKYRPEYLDDLNCLRRHSELAGNLNAEMEAAEQKFKAHKEFRKVQEVLKRLPLKYQEVIALRYFEECTVSEIAAILNKREGTVRSLLSRGLEKVRTKIDQYG